MNLYINPPPSFFSELAILLSEMGNSIMQPLFGCAVYFNNVGICSDKRSHIS